MLILEVQRCADWVVSILGLVADWHVWGVYELSVRRSLCSLCVVEHGLIHETNLLWQGTWHLFQT